ncbi:MAG: hypothetical protein GC180_05870 [Bacteroidetes bacterium]|nr:hypothetical protein [Bacteroidota bacterium]
MNLSLQKLFFTFVLLLLIQRVSGQSCQIKSDSIVCKDDFIGFEAIIPGGQASSYYWQLGTNNTSTLDQPTAQFNQLGAKTISVIVRFPNGSSCTASKNIFVHDRPVAGLKVMGSSNYCFSQNEVCIEDTSTPGQTGSGLASRNILWGDGFAQTTYNPSVNNKSCYSYPGSGKFALVMEVTDTKGCYSRAYDTVEIYHDGAPKFSYEFKEQCDSVVLCLKNHSTYDTSQKSAWYWNFGDGTIDSVNWNPPCHVYKDSGKYSVSLVSVKGNTCIDTTRKPDLVNYTPIHFNPDIPIDAGCMGTTFSLSETWNKTQTWEWSYEESPSTGYRFLSKSRSTSFTKDHPGTFPIRLKVSSGNCQKTFYPDTLILRGPIAHIKSRNKSLCTVSDSTYFCDNSDLTNMLSINHLWDFGDKYAASCTTHTALNQNVGSNCNFSKDSHPIHFFQAEDCYHVHMMVYDTISGCKDEIWTNVLVGREDPTTIPLTITGNKSCTGTGPDRTVNYSVGTCSEYMLNPDSAAGNHWNKNQVKGFYPATADSTGWITIGVVLLGNDNKECPGITSNPICTDTIWYHKFLHLNKQPIPELKISQQHTCFGSPMEFEISDQNNTELTSLSWDWGDGTFDTIQLNQSDSLPIKMKHTFTQKGKFKVVVAAVNAHGCQNNDTIDVSIGFNMHLANFPFICAGSCVSMRDSVYYTGDSLNYWSMSQRPEKVIWHWGDSSVDSTSNTKCYALPGNYQIKMIAIDSIGCVDSLTRSIQVGGIKAGIHGRHDSLLCSEILQMFDSSSVISLSSGEKIDTYAWDFGDDTRINTVKDPFHFYNQFGPFTIQLKVTSNFGCVDSTSTNLFVIGPEPSFEFVTDTFGCVPLTVEIKNTSKECSQWIWYFGDPKGSTLATKYDSNTVFTYDQPGIYTLHLYGADSINNISTGNKQFCSATYSQAPQKRQVVVLPKPKAQFGIPAKICVDQSFYAVSLADLTYTKHNWDFGDEGQRSSSNRNQSYVYRKAGN